MKIAVSATGKSLDARVDPRFGRAAYLLVVDMDSFSVEVIDNNENINAFKGAGIQAASAVSQKGASVVLTGYCGPNAFKALSAADIRIVQNITGTVMEAVTRFRAGELSYSAAPNAEGHGM